MSFNGIVDDIYYKELTPKFDLETQLKIRCINKFYNNQTKPNILVEYSDFIKKHNNEKFQFKTVCEYGYLQLAKYLYRIDMNINDDFLCRDRKSVV